MDGGWGGGIRNGVAGEGGGMGRGRVDSPGRGRPALPPRRPTSRVGVLVDL